MKNLRGISMYKVVTIGMIATSEDVEGMILFYTKAGYRLEFMTNYFMVFMKPEPKKSKNESDKS